MQILLEWKRNICIHGSSKIVDQQLKMKNLQLSLIAFKILFELMFLVSISWKMETF